MALSRVNRHQQTSGNAHGSGSFTTTSFTPANNTLLVCRIAAMSQADDGLTGSSLTISDSVGLTWTSGVSGGAGVGWSYSERVWTAPVSTGASMTITADAGAFVIENYRVEVYEYSGHDTSTPVGGTATGTDADGNGSASITLSATPATTSEVLSFVIRAQQTGTANPVLHGTGWTELFDIQRADWWVMQAQARAGSTSTTVTWDDLDDGTAGNALGAAMVALEIKEAPPGPRFILGTH